MTTDSPTAIVVDDDAVTRSVVSGLVADHGVRVLAEADTSIGAIDLIERFRPDLVVLDMALAIGNGDDVLAFVRQCHLRCEVVVFTAYAAPARGHEAAGIRVVEKPLFDDLERALDVAIHDVGQTEVATERRRPSRHLQQPSLSRTETGLDDAADFYQSLAGAEAGDALVGIPVENDSCAAIALAVRRAVRAEDRMVLRGDTLVVLLVGAGTEGPPAVLARVGASHPDAVAAAKVSVLVAGSDPTSAFGSVLVERSTVAKGVGTPYGDPHMPPV